MERDDIGTDISFVKLLKDAQDAQVSSLGEDTDCLSLAEMKKILKDNGVDIPESRLKRVLRLYLDEGILEPTMGRKKDSWGRIGNRCCYRIVS